MNHQKKRPTPFIVQTVIINTSYQGVYVSKPHTATAVFEKVPTTTKIATTTTIIVPTLKTEKEE